MQAQAEQGHRVWFSGRAFGELRPTPGRRTIPLGFMARCMFKWGRAAGHAPPAGLQGSCALHQARGKWRRTPLGHKARHQAGQRQPSAN